MLKYITKKSICKGHSVHSGLDERRMENALTPKTILDNRKTQKKSFLPKIPACGDGFAE